MTDYLWFAWAISSGTYPSQLRQSYRDVTHVTACSRGFGPIPLRRLFRQHQNRLECVDFTGLLYALHTPTTSSSGKRPLSCAVSVRRMIAAHAERTSEALQSSLNTLLDTSLFELIHELGIHIAAASSGMRKGIDFMGCWYRSRDTVHEDREGSHTFSAFPVFHSTCPLE